MKSVKLETFLQACKEKTSYSPQFWSNASLYERNILWLSAFLLLLILLLRSTETRQFISTRQLILELLLNSTQPYFDMINGASSTPHDMSHFWVGVFLPFGYISFGRLPRARQMLSETAEREKVSLTIMRNVYHFNNLCSPSGKMVW